MPVTEVGCMGVKPSFDVMNEDTPEGQILKKLYNYVVTAPGGPLRVYWGLEVEDPSYLWAFFDWGSIEAHENFARTLGEEAVQDMPKIFTHGLFTKHVTATASLPATLRSSMTEIVLFYFPPDLPLLSKEALIARLEECEQKERDKIPGLEAMSYGWGVENDFPVRGGFPDQRASVLIFMGGFEDTACQKNFRGCSEKFLGFVRSTEGFVKTETFSVSFQSLSRNSEEGTINDM